MRIDDEPLDPKVVTIMACTAMAARPNMDALKWATREAHDRAAEAVWIYPDAPTWGAYRAYLERLLGFYAPLEAALASLDWSTVGLDFHSRRNVPRLTCDLRALGHDAASLDALARLEALPDVAAMPEAFGALYVIEGASLGGLIIAEHLARSLGVDSGRGASFFDRDAPSVYAAWSTVGARLEAFARDAPIQARVEGAALITFDRFERWLTAARTSTATPWHPTTNLPRPRPST